MNSWISWANIVDRADPGEGGAVSQSRPILTPDVNKTDLQNCRNFKVFVFEFMFQTMIYRSDRWGTTLFSRLWVTSWDRGVPNYSAKQRIDQYEWSKTSCMFRGNSHIVNEAIPVTENLSKQSLCEDRMGSSIGILVKKIFVVPFFTVLWRCPIEGRNVTK